MGRWKHRTTYNRDPLSIEGQEGRSYTTYTDLAQGFRHIHPPPRPKAFYITQNKTKQKHHRLGEEGAGDRKRNVQNRSEKV